MKSAANMRQTDEGKVKPMRGTTKSLLSAMLSLFVVFCVKITVHAGIPEPETILYGKVINNYRGNEYVITKGSLEWTIREKTGERRTFQLQGDLESLSEGKYSYQLKVPHEATIAIAGMEVPEELVPLTTDERQYDHVEVLVNGAAARILPPAQKFVRTAQQLRSQYCRVDLEVVFEPADSDGDGMPDWWEELHQLNKFLASDADQDADGDGTTNLEEFLGGSDPTLDNRAPTLATERVVAYEAGTVGVSLRTIDSDSAPSELLYTLTRAPNGGTLYVRDGTGETSEEEPRPGKVLQAGDTFTQEDINQGKIQLRHDDLAVEEISFDLRVQDEDPSHAASSGTVAVDLYRPTAMDGSEATVWLDANFDGRQLSPGDPQALTLWTDRSGPKSWIEEPNPSDYPHWQDGHFHAISWEPVPIGFTGPEGQPAFVFEGGRQFDLPYTTLAKVFPQGDRTLFAVFKSTGEQRQQVVSSTDFFLAVSGEDEGPYAGQVRYGTEDWSVYSHRSVAGDWVLTTACQEGDRAVLELNGVRVAGPSAVEQKALLGTDPVVGAKSVWQWDDETWWEVTDSERFEGNIGEILAFSDPLPCRERQKINFYLLSKWFGYVVWDGSAEGRNQEISVPSTPNGGMGSHQEYLKEFVPNFGRDRSYILLGGAGDDALYGGGEDDILVGGAGDDTLYGGSGKDIFVIRDISEGNDTIEDFNTDEGDAIDLSCLLKGESKDLRNYLRLTTSGTDSELAIDVDGDGSGYTDMKIRLRRNVYRSDDLRALWANGHLITGTIRFPLLVSLAVADPTAIENTGDAAVFSISLSGDLLPQTLSLPFSVGGSARRGEDYHLKARVSNKQAGRYELVDLEGYSIPVRLKPGDSTLEVHVIPMSDKEDETDEDMKLTLEPAEEFYGLGVSSGSVTIEDLPLWVTMESVEPLAILDESIPGAFLVTRTGRLDQSLTVRFQITGSASNGTDYVWIPSFLNFDSGQSSKTIWVEPLPGASLQDGSETVEMTVLPEAISPYRISGDPTSKITIVQTRMNLVRWRAGAFPGETGDMGAFAVEDRDQDGIEHLLEYAFGLDPKKVDHRGLGTGWPWAEVRDGRLTVQFRRVLGLNDIEYVVEVSGDLIKWQSGPQYIEELLPFVNEGESEIVTLADRTPLSEAEKRFVRVRIKMRPQGPTLTSSVFGLHRLRVVNEGKSHCLVSMPFLKPAGVQGRLDGLVPSEGVLIDEEGAFGELDTGERYFLLIRSGTSKGVWFLVKEPPQGQSYGDTPKHLSVDLDKDPGFFGNLSGDEWFSIHPMYELSELFPDDGSVLPAHRFDVMAGQVHLYGESGCTKYWLSNGMLTGEAGWTTVEEDGSFQRTDLYFPPGVSFVVYHSDPKQDMDIPVVGEVPDTMIRKAVSPGYTFLAAEYNTSRTDQAGNPSCKLEDLGLDRSGFRMGETADSSDRVYLWDRDSAKYRDPCWLFENGGSPLWMTEAPIPQEAGDQEALPGTGMVIWHGGEGYTWMDGE